MEIYLGLLLLIGMVALAAANQRLAARLGRLERQLAGLPSAGAVPMSRDVPPRPVPLPDTMPDTVPDTSAVPALAPRPPSPATPTPATRDLFERLVGGGLLVWVGGVALVVAAIYLIRFSIEIGLITPRLRMIAAALFGLALVAGGEAARSTKRLRADLRTSQALVGAGLAVLYATVYGSYLLYGFLDLTAASALMVAITAAALALSLRHGAPTAAMGLAGGFAMPWLVGDPGAGAAPLLAYLALLDAAIFFVAGRRGWPLLAAAAVLASFAWVAVLLVDSPFDAVAGGWFAVGLGVVASLARPGRAGTSAGGAGRDWFQPLVFAAALVAALTLRTDIGGLGWLQFLLLAAATVALIAWRDRPAWIGLVVLNLGMGAATAKFLLIEGDGWMVEAVATLALLFGVGGALIARTRRSSAAVLLACSGFVGPALTLRGLTPDLLQPGGWGLLFVVLAAGPAFLVWALRPGTSASLHPHDPGALLPALAAAGLLALGAHDLVAGGYLSIAWLGLAIAFTVAGIQLPERSLRVAGLALLIVTVLKVFLWDLATLEGVLRILSLLGLGAALIGIGRYYGTLLGAERGLGAERQPAAAT